MPNAAPSPRNYYRLFIWQALLLALVSAFFEINTVLPALIIRTGGTPLQLGILVMIMLGFPRLAQIYSAPKITRRSMKKPVFLLGSFLRVLSLLGIAGALHQLTTAPATGILITTLFAGMILFTMGGALSGVAYMEILGKSLPEVERGRFLGVRRLFNGGGILLSAGLAWFLIASRDFPRNFEVLFSVGSGLLLLAAAGFWFMPEHPTQTTFSTGNTVTVFKFIPRALKAEAGLRRLSVITVVTRLGVAFIPFIIFLAQTRTPLSGARVGGYLIILVVGMLLGNAGWVHIIRRGGSNWGLGGMVILGIFLPLLALSVTTRESGNWFLPVFLGAGVFLGARKISLDSIIRSISTSETRTLVRGIHTVFTLCVAPIPVVIGLAIMLSGYTLVFIVVSIGMVPALLAIQKPYSPRDPVK